MRASDKTLPIGQYVIAQFERIVIQPINLSDLLSSDQNLKISKSLHSTKLAPSNSNPILQINLISSIQKEILIWKAFNQCFSQKRMSKGKMMTYFRLAKSKSNSQTLIKNFWKMMELNLPSSTHSIDHTHTSQYFSYYAEWV